MQVFETVHDILNFHGQKNPGKVTVSVNGDNYTNGDLLKNVADIVEFLREKEVSSGDRIAFLAKNSSEFIELMYASSILEVVMVPINFRLAYEEVKFIIQDSGSKIIIFGEEFKELIEQLNSDETDLQFSLGISELGKLLKTKSPSVLDVSLFSNKATNTPLFQMYTSGTTGNPKGALISQKGIMSLIANGMDNLGPFDPNDVNLVCMPLFHIAGSAWLFFGLASGSKNILLVDINPEKILDIIENSNVATTLMVPAVIQMVVAAAEKNSKVFKNVKNIVFGASPMAVDTLKRAQKIFPNSNFTHVYGMTETTGMFMSLDARELKANRRLESCGKCFSNSEIKIVDSNSNEVPARTIGEIICRTDQIMDGYFNREKANNEAIKDGWFYTGDAGYLDEEGYLFIRDRIKDLIITGGENVYPAEVENALMLQPSISDCAVIGVSDPKWGEAVLALIVVKEDNLPENELRVALRSHLAGFKIPKIFQVVDSLPRNAGGKITKHVLREKYAYLGQ
jgi:acyl-CoA synthetase (AMP-forming)/AMP-acid ligase II